MKNRKIIIAMPTEEVHFVHVVTKNYEVSEMSIVEFPDSTTLDKLKESNLEYLKKKAREILPDRALENAHFEIFCGASPADKMVRYAKKIDANMIVVATRNKRGLAGLFTSSFTDRMLALYLRHSDFKTE